MHWNFFIENCLNHTLSLDMPRVSPGNASQRCADRTKLDPMAVSAGSSTCC